MSSQTVEPSCHHKEATMPSTSKDDGEMHIRFELRPPIVTSLAEIERSSHDFRARPSLCVIHVACEVLRVSDYCRFSACCLYHRYLLSRSLESDASKDVEWNIVIAACLFLACKCTEEPRRLRDVINCAHMVRTPSWKEDLTSSNPLSQENDQHSVSDNAEKIPNLGQDPPGNRVADRVVVEWLPDPPVLDDSYWKTKEQIVEMEQHILRWLAFDTVVSNPYRATLVILQDLLPENDTSFAELLPLALRFVNQSVFSIGLLTKPVFVLACTAIRMGSKRANVSLPTDWSLRYVHTNAVEKKLPER